ncbi:MAG TPA: EamA family transporter [Solirubrobacteraceae bacterium]|nr:EamA family transporter [Solirubrobacteraceae bacterium]
MLATVLLALAASACWGTSDFTSGFKARTVPLAVVLTLTQGIGLVLAVVIVAAAGRGLPGAGPALASLGAGFCVIAGLGCFYRALATGTMSIVAPTAATGVVIPVIAGVLSGDRLAAVQVIGMFGAVVGVVLAARQPDAEASQGDRRIHREAVALALVSAAAFGCYFLLAHIGARGGVGWLLLLAHVTSVIGALAMVALARQARPPALGGDLGVLLLAGALDFAATGLYGLANRHGQLSIVAVAGSLYPVATVLLARWVLRERIVRLQAVGVGLAVAGVALIAA